VDRLELRCPRGHLCIHADRLIGGEWRVRSHDELDGKIVDGVLGFQPKRRRRARRLPSTTYEGVYDTDLGPDLVFEPSRWTASPGTKVVFRCPDCGDPSSFILP